MFKGSIVALVTPMLSDTSVDYSALDLLLEWHISQGTNGLVIVGTTGESATLDFGEHRAVIRRSIEVVNGRIPIIAGTGGNSTVEALELTKNAKNDGADACLLVAPYYNKPPQEGLYQHFKTIADAVDIPQILYNVPGRTVTDILPDTVARLSKISNIIGIKEATGSMKRLQEIQQLVTDSDFLYWTGDDGTAYEFMKLGGAGGISVTGNVAPRLNYELYDFALKKQWKQAEAVNDQLQGLHTELFCQSNPIPVKWALSKLGICGGTLRLPLIDLEPQYHNQVAQAMTQAGVL